LLSGAAVAAASSGAHAQITARQPLRILVPVPAGSASDVVARLIADRLKDSTAQPVVVENRPGATGRVGVDALRSAAPDGTTVLLAGIVVPVIGPLVFKNLSYDPAKDFAPVSQVSRYEFAFAVAANHSARTVPEFVAWASAAPAR
jgi:tripartite-type tricarboxylate transporter receptor subunit TctC